MRQLGNAVPVRLGQSWPPVWLSICCDDERRLVSKRIAITWRA